MPKEDTVNGRRIRRELLNLVGFLIPGFLLVPWVLFRYAPITVTFADFCDRFYNGGLLGELGVGAFLFAWLVVLSPYLLFQFIRSVLWLVVR